MFQARRRPVPKKFENLSLPYPDGIWWKSVESFPDECYRVNYLTPHRWLYFSITTKKWAVLVGNGKVMELHLSNGMLTRNTVKQSMTDLAKCALDWVNNKLRLPDRRPIRKGFMERIRKVIPSKD